jgi:thymidine kinase
VAKLYFYYSAMNAGKSTMLLQSDYNYRERGMDTVLFTPALDDRYGSGNITSRIGLQGNAIAINKTCDLFGQVADMMAEKKNIHCVLVDEAQFLTKEQVRQLTRICDETGIPVLAYGLRTDFQGEPFEGSQYLLAWAEEVSELKTICHCGRKATMNSRINTSGKMVREGDQVQVGHNYVATCRQHFKQGIVKKYHQLSTSTT